MKARIDYTNVPEALRGMYQLEHYIHNSGLEESLVDLVKMRASQINGCAYCLDVHSKDARALGETEQRLYVLDAWEEAPFSASANARRWRLLTPSPGSRKAMCPTRFSSAHERTSTTRS
jgi:AhpD family alkylhydroperoxidase